MKPSGRTQSRRRRFSHESRQREPATRRSSTVASPDRASARSAPHGHVRSVAREWGLADLADTAELVVSELVTNAVQASARLRTAGPSVVVLWITSDGLSLVIHVWDASPEMPVRKDSAPDEESGYGLMLVEALSKDHGVYRKAEGKTVWALITTDP
jgi:anti-sigma regulatory factor (Ser/Thr protein kinase)